jgi:hypothetical protein
VSCMYAFHCDIYRTMERLAGAHSKAMVNHPSVAKQYVTMNSINSSKARHAFIHVASRTKLLHVAYRDGFFVGRCIS